MAFIAERLKAIKPSPTIAVSQKARDLEAAGENIIGLGAGEPDFDTPPHIIKAAKKALDNGVTRYTAINGMPELIDAISAKFNRDNNLNYSRNQIHVSCGGKPVIFNAMMATINPGNEVIVPSGHSQTPP
jgi:aspartate aminotransferase